MKPEHTIALAGLATVIILVTLMTPGRKSPTVWRLAELGLWLAGCAALCGLAVMIAESVGR